MSLGFGGDWEDGPSTREIELERENERLRQGLERIRSMPNGSAHCSNDMQMVAAEILFPGKFPTPERLKKSELETLKERVANATAHLELLYKGMWASNDERDSIIDAAWEALND